jgi:deoxyribonuclease-4
MSNWKLRLGGSTFPFMWQEPALVSLRRLKRLGLGRCDVPLAPDHLWNDAASLAKANKLRREMDCEGLTIDSLSLPALDFNLCSCVEEVRALSVATYLRTIELCAMLGGRGIGVVPGRVSALIPPAERDTMAWLADSLRALEASAPVHGLTLLVETHPHTPVPDSDKLASFLAGFDRRYVKMAYDIATAAFMGEQYVNQIERHADLIGQIHLSDTPSGRWRHDALGTGIIDVPSALSAVARGGFAGVTILEVIAQDAEPAIQRSLEVLKELGAA